MENLFYEIYQKMGDYFMGSSRRRMFYFFVALLFVGVTLVSMRSKIVVELDVLSWTFSSVVQSLLALVALAGVVVVFKYQSMATQEDRLLNILSRTDSDLAMLGGKLDATSAEDLMMNIVAHLPDDSEKDGWRNKKLRRQKELLESNLRTKEFFRDFIIRFCVYTFVVVLLNVLFLILAPIFSVAFLGVPALFLSVFLTAYAFFLSLKIVAEAITSNT